MSKDMSFFETNVNWLATVIQNSSGRLIAIAKGQEGGEFEGKFYLYDEDWTPHNYFPEMTGYSHEDIKHMFSSGELSLIKGSFPD
jgi:hypothetical protein